MMYRVPIRYTGMAVFVVTAEDSDDAETVARDLFKMGRMSRAKLGDHKIDVVFPPERVYGRAR